MVCHGNMLLVHVASPAPTAQVARQVRVEIDNEVKNGVNENKERGHRSYHKISNAQWFRASRLKLGIRRRNSKSIQDPAFWIPVEHGSQVSDDYCTSNLPGDARVLPALPVRKGVADYEAFESRDLGDSVFTVRETPVRREGHDFFGAGARQHPYSVVQSSPSVNQVVDNDAQRPWEG